MQIPKGNVFTPVEMNNAGFLFGENKISNTEKSFASYDTKTGNLKTLKKMDNSNEFTSIGLIAVSDEYVIFKEIFFNENLVNFYFYDLKKDAVELILESTNVPPLQYDKGIIVEDKAYLFLIVSPHLTTLKRK